LIDKGSLDNVKIGYPVIKNNNLIGQISEVNLKSSRVILLKDLNSRIPVLIGEKLFNAIMTGDTNTPGGVKFEFLPKVYEFKFKIRYTPQRLKVLCPKVSM